MAVIHRNQHRAHEGDATATPSSPETRTSFRRALAVLRIAFGITFLWAFLDKTFALGFHTGYDQEGNLDRFGPAAWINGGSPTEGFLSFGVPEDNPFKDVFNNMAGQAWVDWLFMIGLLGIGITLLFGVGMKIGTISGAVMYALMYLAVIPLENNPVVDDHLIGVIVMVVLLLGYAGRTWGFGRQWENTELVRKYPVLQ
jgi:thiosulfate dehydrogenase [quinone] large subunit